MARLGTQDYFIYEQTILRNGLCVIPVQWFTRKHAMTGTQILYAKCLEMQAVATEDFCGWDVVMRDDIEVPQHFFLKAFLDFECDAVEHDKPSPSKLHSEPWQWYKSFFLDAIDPVIKLSTPWTFTDPIKGNRWRALANGSKVVCFPIWLYCDDTSGNLSKKWNKHNSFLFTPAGLPHKEAQKEFNVHFLSTSNIAPPLEMLDGIVDQLE